MSDKILSVEHLMMHFGGIKALNDVNLDVERGSITALIGPNGAGKTTVFNCLTGFYKATGGNILLNTQGRTTDVIQVLGQPFQPGDCVKPAQLGNAPLLQDVRRHPPGEPRRAGADLPEHPPVPRDVGGGEPAGGAAHVRQPQPARRHPQHPRLSPRRERGAGPRLLLAGGGWTWWTAPTAWPARCPTASSGAWRSPGPCAPGRN